MLVFLLKFTIANLSKGINVSPHMHVIRLFVFSFIRIFFKKLLLNNIINIIYIYKIKILFFLFIF